VSTIVHTLTDDEDRLIRSLRSANFLVAQQCFDAIKAERIDADRQVVDALAGEHGRSSDLMAYNGKVDW
jgi:hypothetical protein